VISTAFQLVGTIGRCIVVTQRRPTAIALYPVQGTFLYFSWGGLEAFIQVLYIVWRVDLRFYKPDVLPYKIRDLFNWCQYEQRDVVQNKLDRENNLNFSVLHNRSEDTDTYFQSHKMEISNTYNRISEEDSLPISHAKSSLYHDEDLKDIFVDSIEVSHSTLE